MLPAEPTSVSYAREHVAAVLASLGLTSRELLDDVQLITSELVTNAITATAASGARPAAGRGGDGGNGGDAGAWPGRWGSGPADGAVTGTVNGHRADPGAGPGAYFDDDADGGRDAGLGAGERSGRRAAGGQVRVGAYLTGTCLTLEFWDDAAGVPRPGNPGEFDVSGRGLLLVEALCSRWGYRPAAPGGKTVWVELDVSSYLCGSAAPADAHAGVGPVR
nr:MAG: hypothetical protein DIU60_03515 [Actinomycetota bacterium]